jgi:hypothetical protein
MAVTYGGANYTAAPYILYSGPSTTYRQPVLTATITGSSVSGITITDGGEFSSAPTFSVSVLKDLGSYSSLPALQNIRIQKYVSQINVTSAGSGYSTAPSVYLTPGSNTTAINDATATVTVANNVITGFTVTAGGKYEFYANSSPSPSVSVYFISGVTPRQAVGLVSVNTAGQVTGISFSSSNYPWLTAGLGYTAPPTITINPSVTGKGSGAVARVTSLTTNGAINTVVIDNGGSGYFSKNEGAGISGGITKIIPAYLVLAPGGTSTYNIYLGNGQMPVSTPISK